MLLVMGPQAPYPARGAARVGRGALRAPRGLPSERQGPTGRLGRVGGSGLDAGTEAEPVATVSRSAALGRRAWEDRPALHPALCEGAFKEPP